MLSVAACARSGEEDEEGERERRVRRACMCASWAARKVEREVVLAVLEPRLIEPLGAARVDVWYLFLRLG